jgi:hypothetical protein
VADETGVIHISLHDAEVICSASEIAESGALPFVSFDEAGRATCEACRRLAASPSIKRAAERLKAAQARLDESRARLAKAEDHSVWMVRDATNSAKTMSRLELVNAIGNLGALVILLVAYVHTHEWHTLIICASVIVSLGICRCANCLQVIANELARSRRERTPMESVVDDEEVRRG